MAIPALLQTMERLVEIHETLLELGKEKTKVLVHNEVDHLNRIVNRESVLLRQIGELDKARVDAVHRFLIHKCYKPDPNITVNDIVKLIFKADEKHKLIILHQELLQRIDKLRELNKLNQQLIGQSLQFINYSIDIVLGPSDEDVFYQNPHHQNQGYKRTGLFDTRA